MTDAPPEPPKRKRGRPPIPEHLKKPRVHPSGASKRARKAELDALIAEQRAEEEGRPKDLGEWAAVFKKAGRPDLENPETDLAYTRKLQLLVLQQMATTPFPTRAQESLWRRIREMSATVGMTSSRAALESTVKKLRTQLEAAKQGGTVTEVDGATIVKPDTARGMKRGPRPLPPDPVPDPPA